MFMMLMSKALLEFLHCTFYTNSVQGRFCFLAYVTALNKRLDILRVKSHKEPR